MRDSCDAAPSRRGSACSARRFPIVCASTARYGIYVGRLSTVKVDLGRNYCAPLAWDKYVQSTRARSIVFCEEFCRRKMVDQLSQILRRRALEKRPILPRLLHGRRPASQPSCKSALLVARSEPHSPQFAKRSEECSRTGSQLKWSSAVRSDAAILRVATAKASPEKNGTDSLPTLWPSAVGSGEGLFSRRNGAADSLVIVFFWNGPGRWIS